MLILCLATTTHCATSWSSSERVTCKLPHASSFAKVSARMNKGLGLGSEWNTEGMMKQSVWKLYWKGNLSLLEFSCIWTATHWLTFWLHTHIALDVKWHGDLDLTVVCGGDSSSAFMVVSPYHCFSIELKRKYIRATMKVILVNLFALLNEHDVW